MNTWIALLRGINVGGNNILPMAEFRSELESLNLKNVRTYIQSGNVVFDSAVKSASSLTTKIGERIEIRYGFRPQIFILSREGLLSAIESNPFTKATSEPKTLHFCMLSEPATNPDLQALDRVKTATESYNLTNHVFYLHAPDGIGRSKLAAVIERSLGVTTTSRNFRTIDKLRSTIESN